MYITCNIIWRVSMSTLYIRLLRFFPLHLLFFILFWVLKGHSTHAVGRVCFNGFSQKIFCHFSKIYISCKLFFKWNVLLKIMSEGALDSLFFFVFLYLLLWEIIQPRLPQEDPQRLNFYLLQVKSKKKDHWFKNERKLQSGWNS